MKIRLITAFLALTCLTSHTNAQQIELAISVNSGWHYFAGEDARKNTGIILTPSPQPDVYSLFGTHSGFSYELSSSIQRVTRKKMIYGLAVAYQSLQSKADITLIWPSIVSSAVFPATGNSTLTSKFIGITPYVGYRLVDRSLTLDFRSGLETAYCIDRDEKIDAVYTWTGVKLNEEYDVSPTRSDLRVSFQLNGTYRSLGINAGYFLGIKNYFDDDAIGDPVVYSRFLWLGISYRIKTWNSSR